MSQLCQVFDFGGFCSQGDQELVWNEVNSAIVGRVHCIRWKDAGIVRMISTIHSVDKQEDRVEKPRVRPSLSVRDNKAIKNAFGDHRVATISIPKIINDYNHLMNGVDLADQRRSYFSNQHRVKRNWMPLFRFLIDVAIVNSYLIFKKNNPIDHRDFRASVVRAILTKHPHPPSIVFIPPLKRRYVTAETTRSEIPQRNEVGGHLPIVADTRGVCYACRIQGLEPPGKTQMMCRKCNVHLCIKREKNCFLSFHRNDLS